MQNYRNWQDLTGRRLFFGLMAAPAAGILLVAAPLQLMSIIKSGDLYDLKFFGTGAILIYVPSVILSLAAGTAYLLLVVRRRGRIRRTECLVIGAVVAILLPGVMFPILELVDSVYVRTDESGANLGTVARLISNSLKAAAFLALPGVFGGWVFWRIAIRGNGRTTLPETASPSR